MSYTIRTTEKSLSLLIFKSKGTTRSQRNLHRSTFDHIYNNVSNSKRSTSSFKNIGPHHRIDGPKIKSRFISTTQIRPSSTVPLDSPFLNPMRPDPCEVKATTIEPIVPLSVSKFPKSNLEIPSVTRILQDTMPAASKFLLDRWRESMLKKLGIEGFNKYQAETFERGRLLHALIASYLMGHGEPTDGQAQLSKEIVQNLWKSIQNVVKDKIRNVRLVEHIVTHRTMNYRGIVDCVAFYEDELVVIDFKTAEKPKGNIESLYDNPLQVTAYCGALNSDLSIPNYVIDRNICSGVVIVAYIDGSEASVFHLSREKVANEYWKQWVSRLDQYSRLAEIRSEQKRGLSKK